MYEYKDSNNKKRLSFSNAGWYYDRELSNPMTSCSLHPNRELHKIDGEGKKVIEYEEDGKTRKTYKISQGDRVSWFDIDDDNDRLIDETSYNKHDDYIDAGGEGGKYGYRKKPICSSILTEDFNVTAANEWQEFGGDPLGEIWKTLKPMAPYAKQFSSALREMSAQQDEVRDDSTVKNSIFANGLMKVVDTLDNSDLTNFMNRNLVCQGTRFAYYNGTGLEFSNLGMRFTLFPKWELKDGQMKFISVQDQVEEIYPYAVGRFVPMNEMRDTGTDNTAANSKWVGKGDSILNKAWSSIKEMLGWELPPGGFEADIKYIDATQAGTLMLRLGPLYQLRNLVISNANFVFSKQMVKDPTKFVKYGNVNGNTAVDGTDVLFSPLYCDVTLMLRPITKYSEKMLREFVDGTQRSIDRTENHLRMLASLNRQELEMRNSFKR